MSHGGLAIGLLAILYLAVLGYGGTDLLILFVVEIGVFLLTVIALWQCRREQLFVPIVLTPFVLLAYVSVQWLVLTGSRTTIQNHLVGWLAYVCVFLVAFLVGQRSRACNRFILGLLALGFLESIYGLVQYLTGLPYVLAWRNVFYAERATGTYVNPNHFSGFLEMLLPLGVSYALYRFTRLRADQRSFQALRLDSERTPRLVVYFVISLFLFLGIIFSRSRMGIFCALAVVVAVVLLWASSSWRRGRAALVLVVFLLGSLSLGLWLGLGPVIERYEATEQDALARLAIWKDAVALIQERPLLGTGLGTFGETYTQEQTTAITWFVDHAHNDYLEFAAELGLPGALLLFGLLILGEGRIISAFYQAQRSRTRFCLLGCAGSVLGILLHSLADFNLQIPANALVFAAILGLGFGLRESERERPRGWHGHGRRD